MRRNPVTLLPLLNALLLWPPAFAQDPHAHHGHTEAAQPAASDAKTETESAPHRHEAPDRPAETPPPGQAPVADEHSAHRPGAAPLAPATPADADRLPPPTPEALQAAFPVLHDGHDHMRGSTFTKWQLERLEAREDERTEFFWDGKVSWGNELDRLWLGSEGHRVAGTSERQVELFWTHAFARWWESRLGLRRDAAAGGEARDWLELGLQGEAPYGIEVEALAFAGEDERTALRLVLEYEARLTNRLQLVPRIELNAYGRDDPANGLGSGLAGSELGLRLRYELRREVAPYLGVQWSRRHGGTADLARIAGEPRSDAQALLGISLWY
jgi:copper resistance protein B